MFSLQQFDRIRRLALSLAGIELVDRHRELLASRCERLGLSSSDGLDSLLSAAEQGEPTATQKMLCLLTTKFTGFLRHPGHFTAAAEHAVQVARQGHGARLWSTAAATGQEPYSLAMALLEAFGREDPPVTILATDIDEDAVGFAERGEYGDFALQMLDTERRSRFFDRRTDSGAWTIIPAVRRLVEFRTLNLASVAWAVEGPFEVIFCRNVLMYLEASYRYAALERIASLLVPGGLLILDPTEHLGEAGHWFAEGRQGLHLRREPSARLQQSGAALFAL